MKRFTAHIQRLIESYDFFWWETGEIWSIYYQTPLISIAAGMEVLLNIEEYYYDDSYPGEIYKYKSVGAVVVVHGANQMPFPVRTGILVSPGTAVDIKVTKVADWITKLKTITETVWWNESCLVDYVTFRGAFPSLAWLWDKKIPETHPKMVVFEWF